MRMIINIRTDQEETAVFVCWVRRWRWSSDQFFACFWFGNLPPKMGIYHTNSLNSHKTNSSSTHTNTNTHKYIIHGNGITIGYLNYRLDTQDYLIRTSFIDRFNQCSPSLDPGTDALMLSRVVYLRSTASCSRSGSSGSISGSIASGCRGSSLSDQGSVISTKRHLSASFEILEARHCIDCEWSPPKWLSDHKWSYYTCNSIIIL